MPQGALSDLKVVEYAHSISGPYCAKLLADLGAEVIKVEEPGVGDKARRSGPFPQDTPHPERSGLFLYLNANKLGITLNLDTATGSGIFKELIEQADILVENNPFDFMAGLGLGYDSLSKINPRLVMTSITPFGETGPYRHYKASELISFHSGGLGYDTPGVVDDPEQEPPLKAGGHQAQFLAGVTAALITLCAVFARRLSGWGQHIDLSEQEAVASLMRSSVAYVSYGNPLAMTRRKTEQPPIRKPFLGIIPCMGGYVCTVAIEDDHWRSLMKLMGDPDWGRDEMCRDRLSRAEHAHVLEPRILEWTAKYEKDELSNLLQGAHIPCFPINDIGEVMHSDQLAARGFFVEVEHPEAGRAKFPGAPFKLCQTPWQLKRPAPLLGEHNVEVLCHRLGFARKDLVKMREGGII